MNNKIMILDGNSLLFRAFYAMPPLKTKKGQYTNAVYGFLSMLYKLIDTYSPDYICTAFDPEKPTFRHEQYKDYKAGRAKAPNELVEQFKLIRDVLEVHNIKCIEINGFEADDVAGTIACEAEKKGAEVYLVTSDKDYLQLISENIKVLLTKKGVTNIKEMDEQAISDDYGISPTQFVDLKALMGDQSDNIPGVMGVGEKTALKLIQQYGSLDCIYDNIEEIKGKLKEKLEGDKIQAYMSQTLARIIKDIPIEFDLEEFRLIEPDANKLIVLYDELEFRNFKKRVKEIPEIQNDSQMSMFDSVSDGEEKKLGINNISTSEDLTYVDNKEDIAQIILKVKNSKKVAVKFLLDGERALYSNAVCLGISDCKGSIFYIDFNEVEEKFVLESLKEIFESKDIIKIGHGIKSEVIYLMKKSIFIENIGFDSEIGKYLLDPSESSYSIDKLAYEYLKVENSTENEYLGTGKKRLSFKEVEQGKSKEYLFNYLNTVVKLEEKMCLEIQEFNMTNLFQKIELPLIEVLAYMEYEGFKVDLEILNKLGVHFAEKISSLEEKIYILAGEKFNINSPKQLSVILFEKLGLTVIKKTKTGISTNAEVLEKLKSEHEIVSYILEYRQMVKLNSTYVEGLKSVTDINTNRVHSIFNQTIASTGRISSTEPNLQNIPTRTDEGRELRKAFVTEDGYVLCDADYSQIELRVLAHLADETNLIESFKNGVDIHTKTASEVFKVKIEDVTYEMRSRAKAVNFGIVYGISDYGLSRDLDIPRKESKVYIENYLSYYKNIEKYMKDIVEQGKKEGYVETYFGRRRYIPELSSRNFNIRSFGERIALNTPVQGTAADIIKAAMVNVYNRLKNNKMKSKLILQVHDELIIETHLSELEEVKKILKEEMENVVNDFKVHLDADVNVGGSWYEAK
ncbi:DNA polymerase-1 [Sedimentibacter acidaminivorans]|uniref:DNA polymerase I n=1 Tax=Sedimentibacter acidaminivorans TaxID=913099 RepID=A0ABS4GEJ8_9FIRM|nr:DNA polymerase I [Sedimentibacter acidaminivorans]MBP1926121.1 DNA polymerase-1 [Sedimentibacter acidaminivorans]